MLDLQNFSWILTEPNQTTSGLRKQRSWWLEEFFYLLIFLLLLSVFGWSAVTAAINFNFSILFSISVYLCHISGGGHTLSYWSQNVFQNPEGCLYTSLKDWYLFIIKYIILLCVNHLFSTYKKVGIDVILEF